jgi:hypothetical protein
MFRALTISLYAEMADMDLRHDDRVMARRTVTI